MHAVQNASTLLDAIYFPNLIQIILKYKSLFSCGDKIEGMKIWKGQNDKKKQKILGFFLVLNRKDRKV